MKEWEDQENVGGKYEVLRGGDVEIVKVFGNFRDRVKECTNGVFGKRHGLAEKKRE